MSVLTVAHVMDWLRTAAPAALQHHLQSDSRRVARGDVFVALPGMLAGKSRDGREFIGLAVSQGAAAVIVEADGLNEPQIGVPLLAVPNLRAMLGALASRFYGDPSRRTRVIGVTGTNGKTSCTHWIAQSLGHAGTPCAVIGTVGSGFLDALRRDNGLTTPDAIGLQRELRRLADAGAAAVAMEVSSIGLVQGRVDDIRFDIALFTNLTRDHLDYHGDMARYEAAKTILFDWPALRAAVVNLDDPMGQRLVARLRERDILTIGYAIEAVPEASLAIGLRASALSTTPNGLAFEVTLTRLGVAPQTVPVVVELAGRFNVANVLGVMGVLLACDVSFEQAAAYAAKCVAPAGRMQRVTVPNAPLAVIDYAHTPDALEKALLALRPLVIARGGRLWVVFGAGGDRDPGKRAPMGAAARAADRIVITSDNPRTEDPTDIVDAVAAGVAAHECECIVDRAQAIARTLAQAAPADVVLIAGKGHEDYQEIGGRKLPFSDVEHARAALTARTRPAVA